MRKFFDFVRWFFLTLFFLVVSIAFLAYGSNEYTNKDPVFGIILLLIGAGFFLLVLFSWIKTSNRLGDLLKVL